MFGQLVAKDVYIVAHLLESRELFHCLRTTSEYQHLERKLFLDCNSYAYHILLMIKSWNIVAASIVNEQRNLWIKFQYSAGMLNSNWMKEIIYDPHLPWRYSIFIFCSSIIKEFIIIHALLVIQVTHHIQLREWEQAVVGFLARQAKQICSKLEISDLVLTDKHLLKP